MTPLTRPFTGDDLAGLQGHLLRHRAESGRGDHHFMPFAPDDTEGPSGIDVEAIGKPLNEIGWQRWFIAIVDDGTVIGHVDLKGDRLKTGLHRCELGIGIERAYRGRGLGQRLMETAIHFAREANSLAWVDLRVFGHNASGRALYRSLGFSEIGTIEDRFRIEGRPIDDVVMALNLERRAPHIPRNRP